MEQRRRDAVVELFCAGHGPADISRLLKYNKQTVYGIVKRFKTKGDSQRKKHNPRKDRIRTPRFLSGLKKSIKASPGTPMTVLTKKLNICKMTVSRAVRHDLGYKSYALKVRHLQKVLRL